MTAPSMPEVYAQECWGAHEVAPAVSGWGDAIPVDGVRPSWLPDDVPIETCGHSGIWSSGPVHYAWHITKAIRLPVPRYDFVYLALERGMVPWFAKTDGSFCAPEDYDDKRPVLFADKAMLLGFNERCWGKTVYPADTIIGYHALPFSPPAAPQESWLNDPASLDGGEPLAAVEGEEDLGGRRNHIRRSIIRQLGGDNYADRVILDGTDWDIILAALAHPAAVEGEDTVTVPRVPTEAMLWAGSMAGGYDGYRQEDNTIEIWDAILAALAPAAIASGRGEGE